MLRIISAEEWRKKGKELYGENARDWKFRCPACGHIQTAQDFRDNDIDPNGKVYYSCIGRWVPGNGCDWTLGGLLTIHTLEVIGEDDSKIPVFEFADDPDAPEPKKANAGSTGEDETG